MDGSLDSIVYVDTLQTSLLDTLEYYDMNRNVIRFQQDNATPHTSGITKEDWPAKSPDLNPIKHIWVTTKEELEACITSEWYKFTNNGCLKYIHSIPARIKMVIRSGEGPTRF
ncbi:hypothetical protein INT46_011851 [Mucor plumbeus]|uniref:Uncharacterized protein n=1 Tax=Mucor plumbeus TaxID=97098 RepID=A0A8H7UQL0_9FUNG|nr:hypothetical protein INT46_011851 [Mucor plumbeus]